jgi:hypothetical protein
MSFRAVLDFSLFARPLRGVETVWTGWGGGETDVCEGVDVIYTVVLGGTVRGVREMEKREVTVIFRGWEVLGGG